METTRRMIRKVKVVFLIAFLSMLLIPLVLTDYSAEVSDIDGRTLAAPPAFGETSFRTETESWLKDRLGLRDSITSLYARANEALFDELIDSPYQYGKDGHTFVRLHSNIEYNEYHRTFAEMVAEMQKYCESRGSTFFYVFNPEKESIYREQLPEGANYDDSWADEMLSYMDTLGVNCIDLRDVLTEEKEKPVFDRKNDAGHWNQNGAFYGMREITARMHQVFPKVKILEEDEYDITLRTVQRLGNSKHIINEKVPVYALKHKYTDETGSMGSELEKDPQYPYFQLIRNDSAKAGGVRRMLLFEDDLYAQFAVARAKETAILTCLRNAVNFDYYYNIFKPEVVVFENLEYALQDTYFSQAEMESADHNPAILENYPENDFQERRELLLEQTEEVIADTTAVLVPGKAIDRVFLSRELSNTRYAYLITDNRVIDLNDNGNGVFTASVRHGDLTDGSQVVLYTLKGNKVGRYASIPVSSKKKDIAVRDTSSENTVCNKSDSSYTMTNSMEDDVFSYTAVHLYNEGITEYLTGIGSPIANGTIDGAYSHKLPTGDYALLLKAGSSATNEWESFKVHLVKGRSYWFTYNVEMLSDKKVTIRDFRFWEPAEVIPEDEATD